MLKSIIDPNTRLAPPATDRNPALTPNERASEGNVTRPPCRQTSKRQEPNEAKQIPDWSNEDKAVSLVPTRHQASWCSFLNVDNTKSNTETSHTSAIGTQQIFLERNVHQTWYNSHRYETTNCTSFFHWRRGLRSRNSSETVRRSGRYVSCSITVGLRCWFAIFCRQTNTARYTPCSSLFMSHILTSCVFIAAVADKGVFMLAWWTPNM